MGEKEECERKGARGDQGEDRVSTEAERGERREDGGETQTFQLGM